MLSPGRPLVLLLAVASLLGPSSTNARDAADDDGDAKTPAPGTPAPAPPALRAPLTKKVPSFNISRSSNVYNVPLFGGMEQGEYYVYLEVGTPPLKFRVQVDTGSALLFVPAVECSECTIHTNDLYDISASSTAERVGCDSELCDRNTCKQSSFCHNTCSAERNACCAESDPTECGPSAPTPYSRL